MTLQTMTTSPSLSPPSPPAHWSKHLTLDFFAYILQRSLLHPFICFLIPLSLLALHHPVSSTGIVYTSIWFCIVTTWTSAAVWNHRFAYGRPRNVDVEEEVVLVAGGWGKGGGLGRLLAEVYAMKGARGVAVLDLEVPVEGGEEREEWEDRGVRFWKCDVADREAMEKVKGEVIEEFDVSPTIVINCIAAPIVSGELTTLTSSQFSTTIASNITSHFNLIAAFLPAILSPTNTTGGTIVSLSSVTAHMSPANLGPYSASKAALSSLHHTLTAEIRNSRMGHKVKTILVEPGQINTQLFAGVETPSRFLAPVLDTREVCKAITTLIDAGEGGVIRAPVFAGWVAWYAVLPVAVQRLVRWVSGIDDAMVKAADKGRVTRTGKQVPRTPKTKISRDGSTSGDDIVIVEKI